MVSLNPANARIIKVTTDEQLALLQHCPCIDDDIRRTLFSSQDGVLTLTPQQCDELQNSIGFEIDRIENDEVANALGEVYNKLNLNPTTRSIAEKLNSMSFENIEQMQKAADKVMSEQNRIPDPEFGGLSPMQVHNLIYVEWDKPEYPMKLNKNLNHDDIKDVPVYQQALLLLHELNQLKNKPTATSKGNLNRKVVHNIIDKLDLEDDFITKHITESNKRINEQEIFVIWRMRLICQMAGLIRKNKNKFLVTQKGLNFMVKEKAGTLYHLLFLTHLRKLNIGFFGRLPNINGLQSTLAYTIYHLGRIAHIKVKFKEIYHNIILPAVMKEVDYIAKGFIHPSFIIRQRVIEPLEFSGLLECEREKVKILPEIVSLEISPLFEKFVQFEI